MVRVVPYTLDRIGRRRGSGKIQSVAGSDDPEKHMEEGENWMTKHKDECEALIQAELKATTNLVKEAMQVAATTSKFKVTFGKRGE